MNILYATGKNLEGRRNKVFRVIVPGHPKSEIVNGMIFIIDSVITYSSIALLIVEDSHVLLLYYCCFHDFILSIHRVWYDVCLDSGHPLTGH